MKISLKAKLILTSLLLVVVPIGIIGGYSLTRFRTFGTHTTEQAFQGMSDLAGGLLDRGVLATSERVTATIIISYKKTTFSCTERF